MILFFLLILCIIQLPIFITKDCRISGKLERNDYRLITNPNGESLALYLDMSEFDDIKGDNQTIEIQVDVRNGDLTETEMYYGVSNEEYTYGEYNIPIPVNYTRSSSKDKKDYKIKTYYFEVPKSDPKYLYISVPEFKTFAYGWIEIKVLNHYFFEGTIWEIIGLVLGGVAVVFIIILSIHLIKLINNAKINPSGDKTPIEKPYYSN